jgi:hypothetical protein
MKMGLSKKMIKSTPKTPLGDTKDSENDLASMELVFVTLINLLLFLVSLGLMVLI